MARRSLVSAYHGSGVKLLKKTCEFLPARDICAWTRLDDRRQACAAVPTENQLSSGVENRT
jgi:hypothetical protein